MSQAPKIDIIPEWPAVHADLLRIVDLVPEDKLNWSPKKELWNFRGILIHVSDARDQWLSRGGKDGGTYPNIWATARSKDDLRHEMVRTFERLQRFLADPANVDATYTDEFDDGQTFTHTGHRVAFHALEHDIHHRADLLHYLALLDIPHGIDVGGW